MTERTAGFAVIGINHEQAGLDIRDRLAFHPSDAMAAYARLQEEGRIQQMVILSTCNRSEMYFVFGQAEDRDYMEGFYQSCFAGVDTASYRYGHEGRAALDHLFCVAAGLDSLVLGEDQIIGQVQDALSFAQGNGCVGKEMHKIFRDAITAAKRVKTQLKISQIPLSVCYIGVQLLEETTPIAGKQALVVGSGKMAELALRYLQERGAQGVWLCNRSMDRALALAARFDRLTALPYAQRYEALAACDILISATSSPHVVIGAQGLGPRQRPLAALDLATPRDIDPTLAQREGVTLLNIDSLQQVAERNLAERRRLCAQGRAMLVDDVTQTLHWLHSSQVDGSIRTLQEYCTQVEQEALSLLCQQLGLDAHQQRQAQCILHSSFRRLLRQPILALKDMDDNAQQQACIGAIQALFKH